MADDRKHFILCIGSNDLNINGFVEEIPEQFVVIAVTDKYAEVVADGFATYEEAKRAWPEAR